MPWREFRFSGYCLGGVFCCYYVFKRELFYKELFIYAFFSFFFFSHPKRVNLFPFSCNGRTTDDGKMNLAILILTLGITPNR